MQRVGIFIKHVFFTMILLGLSNTAWAVSASVAGSVGATTVSINANGSGFVNDTHCSNALLLPSDLTCPSVYTHQGGSVSVSLDGNSLGRKSTATGSSASFSATLQRNSLSQGVHTVSVLASDSHDSTPSSSTFTIDNTPSISITGPTGTVRGGPGILAGTAIFIGGPNTDGNYGLVSVSLINSAGVSVWSVSRYTASPSFDLSALGTIPTNLWPKGDYTVTARARATNGAAAVASSTFTVDNTPLISLTGPTGTVYGGPGILAGTVTFIGGPNSVGNYGSVYVKVYNPRGRLVWSTNGDVASPSFDLSTLGTIPTNWWGNDNYIVEVRPVTASGGGWAVAYSTFTVDNTPLISLTGPTGIVCGSSILTGTATFISGPNSVGNYGSVYVKIYNPRGRLIWFVNRDVASPSFDLSALGTIPTNLWANGDYTVRATAGGSIPVFSTFTVNKGIACVPSQPSPPDLLLSGGDQNSSSSGRVGSGNAGGLAAKGFCPLEKIAKTPRPIRIATGDKEQVDRDFSIGNLSLIRSYHSQSTHSGRFGYGWTYNYGWKLSPPSSGQLSIRRSDGKMMLFADDGTGTFVRQFERMDETVFLTAKGFRYTHHNKSTADFDASGNLLSLNSEDGQSTTLTYDVSGKLASISDPFGRSVSMTVDVNGHISTVTGPTGRIWSYAYDVNNNLISVTYPDGTSRQYVYTDVNDIHNLTQIIDEAGRIYKQVTYDAQDRAVVSALPLIKYQDTVTYNADGTVSVTESDGTVRNYTVTTVNGIPSVTSVSGGACACGTATSFTLDPATGLLTSDADKNGVTNSYTYDANGRMLTQSEAVGTAVSRTTTYSYDAAGHVATMTDSLGNITSYTYDVAGRVLTTTDALSNITSNVWNTNGTLASVSDAGGNVTSYGYDTFGQVISITNPDLSTRSMGYDGAGRIVSVTDEAGNITAYTYDVRDRVVSIGYPDGTSVTNIYDVAGDLVSSADTAGLVTTYTYDVEHRPVSMTRPDGSVVNATFNAKGNLTARDILDATGVSALTEAMAYDADGRLTATTHGDATSTSNTYDMVGRLLTSTDEAGKVSTNTYDELGHVVSVTNANGEIATYAYDAVDRLIRTTAANGVTTTFAFDAIGRLIQEASSDRSFTDYTYNTTGDLASKTDGNGIISNYTYDSRHRMLSISYPVDPTRNVSFTYDLAGHLNGMTDVSGITAYTHDVRGRVTSASWSPAGSTLSLILAYSYDASGRLASLTYPTGRVVTYSYDTAGRIGSVDASANGSPMNLASSITYDALGNITARTLGNGIVETRTIDSRGRVVTIDAAGVMSRSLIWSADSNITAIADNLNPIVSQSFAYDLANRLTSALGGYGNISYSYDANGNRLSKTDAAGTISSAYEVATNRLASAGATIFTRDVAGNRLSDGSINYTYAVNNRLIAVSDSTTGAPLAGYSHNGKGERVSKTVNGVTTWFVYDLSGNLIGEYDSNGVMIAEHLYGPSGRIVTIRNQQVPVVLNQLNPLMMQYAGLFNLREYALVALARRRLS